MSEKEYRQTIRELSDRIVEAQKPLRILDSVKWSDETEQGFFAAGCRELPAVDGDYYRSRPLPFDPEEKMQELRAIELDVVNKLGRLSSVGDIMKRLCQEYLTVVRLLAARGSGDFGSYSVDLYGSTHEAFFAGEPTLADFGNVIARALRRIDKSLMLPLEEKTIPGPEAVEILGARLENSFGGRSERVPVILDDGIVSDASAGAGCIKIRKDAYFTERDLRLLEVHEGWVHVGTTLNGDLQPVCTFLSKGPPSATVTQEGLAVLMEFLTFASHPDRLRRLTNRIRAVHMAEEGANFLEVFKFFQEEGLAEKEAYTFTMRVFRGSVPEGKPFTKDISYTKGFVLIYNFLRFAVKRGRIRMLPLLFCGKTVLQDMRTLDHLLQDGILEPPRFIPPQFADLHALTSWMCCADFLGGLNSERLETDYASFF